MSNYDQDVAYLLAKHKTEKLKRFYMHSIIYVIINCGLIFVKVNRNMNNGESFADAFFEFNTFSTAIIWVVVLAIHAFSVFGNTFILGSKWEEEKIKQYIKEEQQNKTY